MTPIGMLCVLAFLTGSSWVLVSLVRRLCREQAGPRRWVAFAILGVIGLSVGAWCAFRCEYPMGAHYRIGSFPIPVVFFHLEDGQWVDFPGPRFQAWAAKFTNIITMTALATLPLWLLLWRQYRPEHRTAQPSGLSQ